LIQPSRWPLRPARSPPLSRPRWPESAQGGVTGQTAGPAWALAPWKGRDGPVEQAFDGPLSVAGPATRGAGAGLGSEAFLPAYSAHRPWRLRLAMASGPAGEGWFRLGAGPVQKGRLAAGASPNRAPGCKTLLAVMRGIGAIAASRRGLLHARHSRGTGFQWRCPGGCMAPARCGGKYLRSFSNQPSLAAAQRAPCRVQPAAGLWPWSSGGGLAVSSPGGVWLSGGPALAPEPSHRPADPGLAVGCRLALQLEKPRTEGGNQVAQRPAAPTGTQAAGLLPRLPAEIRAHPLGPQVDWGSMCRNRYAREAGSTWPRALDDQMPRQARWRPSPPASSSPWIWAAGHAGDRDGVVIEARQRLHLRRPPANTGRTVAAGGTEPGRQPSALALGEQAPGLANRTF